MVANYIQCNKNTIDGIHYGCKLYCNVWMMGFCLKFEVLRTIQLCLFLSLCSHAVKGIRLKPIPRYLNDRRPKDIIDGSYSNTIMVCIYYLPLAFGVISSSCSSYSSEEIILDNLCCLAWLKLEFEEASSKSRSVDKKCRLFLLTWCIVEVLAHEDNIIGVLSKHLVISII